MEALSSKLVLQKKKSKICMRLIFKCLFLAGSSIILILTIYKLLGAYTSLKYEFEEPLAMGKILSTDAQEKIKYLNILIDQLWILFWYTISSIIVAIFFLNEKSK